MQTIRHALYYRADDGAGLTELSDQLSLVYTPVYAPCCLWHPRGGARISHRLITHHHHLSDFEARLSDARA